MCLIHGIVHVQNLLPHSRVRSHIYTAGAKRSSLTPIPPQGVAVVRGSIFRSVLQALASGTNRSTGHGRGLHGLWLDHVGEIPTIKTEGAGAAELGAVEVAVATAGLAVLATMAAMMVVATHVKVITPVDEEMQVR